jgi:hypothetical protein
LAFGVTYVVLYWRIVRFRSPRLLRMMATRPPQLEGHSDPTGDNRPA